MGDCVSENILNPPHPAKKVFFFGGGGEGGNSYPLANRSPKLPSYFPLKILAFKTPSPSEVPMTTHGVCMYSL